MPRLFRQFDDAECFAFCLLATTTRTQRNDQVVRTKVRSYMTGCLEGLPRDGIVEQLKRTRSKTLKMTALGKSAIVLQRIDKHASKAFPLRSSCHHKARTRKGEAAKSPHSSGRWWAPHCTPRRASCCWCRCPVLATRISEVQPREEGAAIGRPRLSTSCAGFGALSKGRSRRLEGRGALLESKEFIFWSSSSFCKVEICFSCCSKRSLRRRQVIR